MTPTSRQPTREELAVCAHDLRGALTIIAGYTDMLRRNELDPDEREAALSGIDAAIKRADTLLADTLAGRPHTRNLHTVDLFPIAEQAVADARASSGRTVELTCSADARVIGDESVLARVLENLLTNAAKYAPDGPIEVTVSSADGLGVVEVADRGPGIPAEDRDRVLEPFVRLERDEDAPGTGLGLTVVRSAVQSVGGAVEITGREGGGTVVRLELPVGAQ